MVEMPAELDGSIYKKRPLITLDTRLRDIPQDWLRYVEPKVVRGGFLPCWQYINALNSSGYPTLRVPGSKNQTTIQRYVAKMFWDFADHLKVKVMCRNHSCVYPHHFYICELHEKPPMLPVEPV